jgi:hypothetical protein
VGHGSGFAPIDQFISDYFLVGAARLSTVVRLAMAIARPRPVPDVDSRTCGPQDGGPQRFAGGVSKAFSVASIDIVGTCRRPENGRLSSRMRKIAVASMVRAKTANGSHPDAVRQSA